MSIHWINDPSQFVVSPYTCFQIASIIYNILLNHGIYIPIAADPNTLRQSTLEDITQFIYLLLLLFKYFSPFPSIYLFPLRWKFDRFPHHPDEKPIKNVFHCHPIIATEFYRGNSCFFFFSKSIFFSFHVKRQIWKIPKMIPYSFLLSLTFFPYSFWIIYIFD